MCVSAAFSASSTCNVVFGGESGQQHSTVQRHTHLQLHVRRVVSSVNIPPVGGEGSVRHSLVSFACDRVCTPHAVRVQCACCAVTLVSVVDDSWTPGTRSRPSKKMFGRHCATNQGRTVAQRRGQRQLRRNDGPARHSHAGAGCNAEGEGAAS